MRVADMALTIALIAAAPVAMSVRARAQEGGLEPRAPETRARERGAQERRIDAQGHMQCFSPAQGREAMAGQKLVDPFACMRETARRMQAEALNARLCRLGEALLYEISILNHDGRVQRIFVDAASGRPHPGRMEKARD